MTNRHMKRCLALLIIRETQIKTAMKNHLKSQNVLVCQVVSVTSNYLWPCGFDWFDILLVQETLKSFLHHHSLRASILQCSAFFMVQLSHLYMNTRNTMLLLLLLSRFSHVRLLRPHRRQPLRLPRPWDSPARMLEWVAVSFSNV